MKNNKIIFMTLLLLLNFYVLSGCKDRISPTPGSVTFSVLYNNRAEAPFRSDWLILQEYKRIKNVTLDIRLQDDNSFDKAIIQTMESNDIPDIILKCWPEQIEKYANAGLLLPFSDYVNKMPYFKAYIAKNNLQSEIDLLKAENGKYYILPGYTRKTQVQQWIYRKDVFDQNGLSVPSTYEELFTSLVTLKKLYPKSTPITACWSGAHLFAMMGAGYGIPAGWAGTTYFNEKMNSWQFAPATDNFKEMYRFLSRCYKAGILDPETLTQDDKTYYQKIMDGRALVTVTWITSGFAKWNNTLKDSGFVNAEWAALPVPESTIGIKALPSVSSFRKGLVVPARVVKEPYFDDLLKFLDWAIYSDEGTTLTTWGIYGTTYTEADQGKAFVSNIKTPKNLNGTIDISKEYGLDSIFNMNENVEFEDYKKPKEIVDFLAASRERNEILKPNPKLVLSAQEIEIIKLINEKLTPYISETSTKFISGDLDIDQAWGTYIKELEKKGYKTIEQIWNNAWVKQK